MATYNKFNQFVEDLNKKKLDVSADSLLLLLSNTSPNAADIKVDTTTSTCTIASTSNAGNQPPSATLSVMPSAVWRPSTP